LITLPDPGKNAAAGFMLIGKIECTGDVLKGTIMPADLFLFPYALKRYHLILFLSRNKYLSGKIPLPGVTNPYWMSQHVRFLPFP